LDASTNNEKNEGGSGAIQCQTDSKGDDKVIAFASRQLLKCENNYLPFLVEMETIVWAMEHIYIYLLPKR
jgi:hypothetical protein